MYWILALFLLGILIFADIKWKILVSFPGAAILLTLLSHITALFIINTHVLNKPAAPLNAGLIALTAYFLVRFSFYTAPAKVNLPTRLKIMMGGRRIYLVSQLVMVLQIPLCILIGIYRNELGLSRLQLSTDIGVTALLFILFTLNGVIRILATSRRLGIVKRVLFLLFCAIPGVNTVLGLWFCKIVKKEFVFEHQKEEIQSAREESQICKTKYPLLMLHGCGFRDYDKLNYWGRIPALLIRNGAVIFYGYQQGWGTISQNAEEVKQRILDIQKETGCERVNIIAHSKGGLDARYCISSLGMGKTVASLTTISTPHRGSELIPIMEKLGEEKYRKISDKIDKVFRVMGDPEPDCYASSRELGPEACRQFNKDNPDDPDIYYQSYASTMKDAASHSLLTVPSALMKFAAGKNDGLVTVESAQWGTYKGTFESSKHRGISHADQIDLMKQDYEGFNMPEEYVRMVAELKNMGF